jgi:hypothetical protein
MKRVSIAIELKTSGSLANYCSLVGKDDHAEIWFHPEGMEKEKIYTGDLEDMKDLHRLVGSYIAHVEAFRTLKETTP